MQQGNMRAAHIKLQLLSEGLVFTPAFLETFADSSSLMPKRRAYNTSDGASLPLSARIPQEIFIGDVVVGVNYRSESRWKLDVLDGQFWLTDQDQPITRLMIREAPKFLQLTTPSGVSCASVANLYGGSSLAYFTPASCYYFADQTQCVFCSLEPTRKGDSEFVSVISPNLASEVLEVALCSDSDVLKQIMIVGGNHRNYDEGFTRHVAILEALNDKQRRMFSCVRLQSHIATMPPRDFTLLNTLCGQDCHLTMNLEVFDDKRFEEVAPGKARDYGRDKLWKALSDAAEILPPKTVHSILVAGLEPVDSTIAGIRALPEIGVSPIVNVLHSDRGTLCERAPRPTYDQLLEIAYALEEVYTAHHLVPYWDGCGRNALDFEARNQWFSGTKKLNGT